MNITSILDSFNKVKNNEISYNNIPCNSNIWKIKYCSQNNNYNGNIDFCINCNDSILCSETRISMINKDGMVPCSNSIISSSNTGNGIHVMSIGYSPLKYWPSIDILSINK